MLEDAEGGEDEAMEADVPTMRKVKRDQDSKIFGKSVSVVQLDPFFEEAKDETKAEIEKRPVMRDGRVPMLQKNVEKAQKEAARRQAIQEGWIKEER